MSCWHKIILIAIVALSTVWNGQAQGNRIIDYSADMSSVDPKIGNGIKRLLGNVRLTHKDLVFTCDSAYFDLNTNQFKGFSRVHIIKADTLHIYGQQIDYSGQTELARLEGNILMDNGKEILKAPRVDYDMKSETATYFGGGQIIDSANTVESFWGYYYLKLDEFVFKENVIVTNPDNTLFTDSLNYNSKSETMRWEGPSEFFSDTNYISCSRGYYDSKHRISSFSKNVYMQAKQQYLLADSLNYNQEAKFSEAFRNIELKDTVENMIIRGDHLVYDENKNRFQINLNVMFILADAKDSLFLHADTLVSTRGADANSRRIQAFRKVQFFRNDFQGRCDSLDYLVRDSIVRLFRDPLAWMDNNQISADTLGIAMGKKSIDRMEMISNGFLITRQDSNKFDQIKGKKIIGHFKDDKLNFVEVSGNGESLFYPKEGTDYIGQNKAVSSNIHIYLKEGKVDKIGFLSDPDSKLIPLKQLKDKDYYLEGFKWSGDKRPLSKEDILIWK